MVKPRTQMAMDIAGLIAKAGMPKYRRPNQPLILLGWADHQRTDPLDGGAFASMTSRLKTAIAWRYLQAGCHADQVDLGDIPDRYKAECLAISKRRAETMRKMKDKLDRENATQSTPAVVQNPTTAEGMLQKLSESNAQLAEESTALMARNAALEENATYMENRLEERQDELVAVGKELDHWQAKHADLSDMCVRMRAKNTELVAEPKATAESVCEAMRTRVQELEADVAHADLQYGALHNENKELHDQLAELKARFKRMSKELDNARDFNRTGISKQEYDHLQVVNDNNADRANEAEERSEILQEENTRLRKAFLEQATLYATILKDLMPQ